MMHSNWLPGPSFTRPQAVAFVQGIAGSSVARGILTVVQILMQPSESRTALSSLRRIFQEVGSTIPETVQISLCLAVLLLRGGSTFSDDNKGLYRRLEER